MEDHDPSFENDEQPNDAASANPDGTPLEENPYAAPDYVPDVPPPKGGAYAAGETTSDEKMWGLFAHLSPLLISFIGPLIIWLIKKEESHFIGTEAKEALNFQLAVMIGHLICIPLMFICIGFFISIALAIASLVYAIMGGIEAHKGNHYAYPSFIPRFIK